MPTSAGTDPDDVRQEIDTDLSDAEIEGSGGDGGILARVERDVDREYPNTSFQSTQHRVDFEAALAALRIAEGNAPDAQDRTARQVSTGSSSVTYEESIVQTLRKRVRRRDPGTAFGSSASIRRDGSRHSTTT